MGVSVEGESSGKVPQHTGHRLDVNSVLQRQRGESVPQIVEPNFGESRPFQHPMEHIQHTIRGDGASIR